MALYVMQFSFLPYSIKHHKIFYDKYIKAKIKKNTMIFYMKMTDYKFKGNFLKIQLYVFFILAIFI